ncbi:hypothetical protein ACQGAO_30575 [Rhodococcus sp. 1.20]
MSLPHVLLIAEGAAEAVTELADANAVVHRRDGGLVCTLTAAASP